MTAPGLDARSVGSPWSTAQCENTIWGNALPPVAARTSALKPKDSITGMCAFIWTIGARALLFGEHNAAAASEAPQQPPMRALWHGDIDKEERLLENRLRQQQRREHYATRGWHDLTHAAMYRVGMKRYWPRSLNETPRICSSQRTEDLDAHWKPATTDSRISPR